MGSKALPIDAPSRAAALVFDRIRVERGLSVRAVFKQGGFKARERTSKLLSGEGEWTLEDVDKFAKCFEISLKKAFLEIEKQTAVLLQSEECPCEIENEIAS